MGLICTDSFQIMYLLMNIIAINGLRVCMDMLNKVRRSKLTWNPSDESM
jgi:hypothetical protein